MPSRSIIRRQITMTCNLLEIFAPESITVNATRNYKFAGTGSITGGGTLTKSGTGTLVVATNNTFSGGTTINSGTVQVGDGGTVGSLGTGPIANEGTLSFNRSDAVTVSNVISGSAGPVRQDGTGTITLSGNNTFFGGLIVNSGTVRLGWRHSGRHRTGCREYRGYLGHRRRCGGEPSHHERRYAGKRYGTRKRRSPAPI